MIETRLQRVFNILLEHEVRYLLMGGQACVIYGAVEFSKDIDFVILADPPNLARVQTAMAALEAEIIAVPPFDPALLDLGLAVHFRCQAEGVAGLRVDLVRSHSDSAAKLSDARPLLELARQAELSALERALIDEMLEEKERDRQYWNPLRAQLEELRRSR